MPVNRRSSDNNDVPARYAVPAWRLRTSRISCHGGNKGRLIPTLVSKQRPPPLRLHIFKRVRSRRKPCILILVENAAQQRDNRAIVNRPQRAAAARAEGAAGIFRRAPDRRLSPLAVPLYIAFGKLQPDNRLGAGMLLA